MDFDTTDNLNQWIKEKTKEKRLGEEVFCYPSFALKSVVRTKEDLFNFILNNHLVCENGTYFADGANSKIHPSDWWWIKVNDIGIDGSTSPEKWYFAVVGEKYKQRKHAPYLGMGEEYKDKPNPWAKYL